MKYGAMVGIVCVGLLAFMYWHGVHGGARPAAVGYGVSIWAALLCVPFGYVFIYGIATPIFGLLHCCESTPIGMATVLCGVLVNCVTIGAIAEWGARRVSRGSRI